MSKRSPKGQSSHDALVRRIAAGYKGRGYTTAADVEGYPRPPVIGGHRPDVVATKGRERKIIEVETPATLGPDKAQQDALRRAAEKRGADFQVRTTRRKVK